MNSGGPTRLGASTRVRGGSDAGCTAARSGESTGSDHSTAGSASGAAGSPAGAVHSTTSSASGADSSMPTGAVAIGGGCSSARGACAGATAGSAGAVACGHSVASACGWLGRRRFGNATAQRFGGRVQVGHDLRRALGRRPRRSVVLTGESIELLATARRAPLEVRDALLERRLRLVRLAPGGTLGFQLAAEIGEDATCSDRLGSRDVELRTEIAGTRELGLRGLEL